MTVCLSHRIEWVDESLNPSHKRSFLRIVSLAYRHLFCAHWQTSLSVNVFWFCAFWVISFSEQKKRLKTVSRKIRAFFVFSKACRLEVLCRRALFDCPEKQDRKRNGCGLSSRRVHFSVLDSFLELLKGFCFFDGDILHILRL